MSPVNPARRVRLDQVPPGLVLAADVTGKHGEVLLRSGSELSEDLCRLLERHGIDSVEVSEQRVITEAERAELRAQALERVDQLFRGRTGASLLALRDRVRRYREDQFNG